MGNKSKRVPICKELSIPRGNGKVWAAGISPYTWDIMTIKTLKLTNRNILGAVMFHILSEKPIPENICRNIAKCNHEFFKIVRAPRLGLHNTVIAGYIFK